MDQVTISRNFILKCNYSSSEESIFEFHLFSLLAILPFAFLLLYNPNLRRFYTPLARVVNISIILSLVTAFVFFYYWNYATSESEGNCEEIFLSRLTTISVMFGELHQIYVIAYSLGLGGMKISLSSSMVYSLEQVLTFATFTVAVSVLLSYFFLRDVLLLIEQTWTVYVSVAQLFIIYTARKSRESIRDLAVVPASDSAISVFEKLSVIQLILALICVAYRVGTELLGGKLMGSIELTLSLLDQTCTMLFYLKTLIIKERTNVTLTIE